MQFINCTVFLYLKYCIFVFKKPQKGLRPQKTINMIITLSPAKVLDFTSPSSTAKQSNPVFGTKAVELNNILKDLTISEIGSLMKINPKQSLEVFQYIQAFDMELTPQKQAAAAYNGIAFAGLDTSTFSEKDWDFAQNHLVILSGLYGALQPLDIIKPYRLEMQTKLVNNKGENLYDYWKKSISEYFNKRLIADDKVWLNLSSNEYSKVIDRKITPKDIRIITPVFKEQTSQGYKQITVYSKKARGMLARYAIQKQIKNIEEIQLFDSEGYSFSPTLSKKDEWVFVR